MGRVISIFSNRNESPVFEDLILPHIDHLYKVAYRFTGTVNDAEDLVQDLLVKLYPKVNEMTKVESLRPWLVRVMYRMWVDRLRHRNRSPVDHIGDCIDIENETKESSPEGRPEEDLQREKLQYRVQHAIDQLSEQHRIILIFHDVEGYSLNEISEILDCATGTLKSRLHRARAHLRKLLENGTF